MKFWIILITVIFVVACTKVELGYRLAPRTMMGRLDNSFSFESERFDQIKSVLDKDFAQNKPAVAKKTLHLIDELFKFSDRKEISPQEAQSFLVTLQNSRIDLVNLFKPSFSEVIGRLSPVEIKNLVDYSNEKISEQETLMTKREKFVDKQLNSFEKVMDFLFDAATNQQEKIYETFVAENQDFYRMQLQGRRNFVNKFSTTQQKSELVEFALAYYSGLAATRTAEHNRIYQKTEANLTTTIAKIWETLTDKQRKNFKENLLDLRAEVLPLAN